MSVSPLICTIVIPVYNGVEGLVRSAIASAAECLDEGIELIVVDSGSIRPVSKDWMPAHPRARLVLFEENLGLFPNWNRAMGLCQGDFVWALCGDDRIVPNIFRQSVAKMRDNPMIALVSTIGQLQSIDQKNVGVIGHMFASGVYDGPAAGKVLLNFYANTLINPYNYPSGILMRRSAMERVGGFDVEMKHIGDIDLYFRMLATGHLCILGEAGSVVTVHDGQTGKTMEKNPAKSLELQTMVKKLGYLTTTERRHECFRLRGLLLLVPLQLLGQRDFFSARKYFMFWLKNHPIAGTYSFMFIVFWKTLTKFSVGRRYWQRCLDQTSI